MCGEKKLADMDAAEKFVNKFRQLVYLIYFPLYFVDYHSYEKFDLTTLLKSHDFQIKETYCTISILSFVLSFTFPSSTSSISSSSSSPALSSSALFCPAISLNLLSFVLSFGFPSSSFYLSF